jgi:hypothetical protein
MASIAAEVFTVFLFSVMPTAALILLLWVIAQPQRARCDDDDGGRGYSGTVGAPLTPGSPSGGYVQADRNDLVLSA